MIARVPGTINETAKMISMEKQKNDLRLKITCGVIILAFFLNWVSVNYAVVSVSASAFDIVFGGGSILAGGFSGILKLLLLLIPLTAGCILYYNIKKGGVYPLHRMILFSIPALVTVIFFLVISSKVSEIRHLTFGFGDNISVADVLGTGFWFCLLASAFSVYAGMDKKGKPMKSNAISKPAVLEETESQA